VTHWKGSTTMKKAVTAKESSLEAAMDSRRGREEIVTVRPLRDTSDTQKRLRAFHARNLEYRRLGHDRVEAARFVLRAAGGLIGPALDIGTGKGLCAIELARSGLEVISVDPDNDEQALAVLLAREAGLENHIQFVRGDAVYLSYPDGHFGCAAMMDVLHHLKHPGPILSQVARVVRKNGVVVLADFDEQGFDLVAKVHRGEGREHSRTATTIERATAKLEKHGFSCLGCTNGYQHDVAVLTKVS
jgi:2-polyprenyl-3-methyl-5-hydroxy-6-metoxy-1,4-benzoquinol methylase